MYRGRPPPRGGYPPPFEGRGPPRPYLAPGYRDDRSRPRPPYHPGYHDHGPPDSHRRSPPRRRYPSPGHGGEYRAGGPPRERSASPPILDHNLVITVGNELTTPAGSAPLRHHDRDYPPRPDYERSRSRGRSRPRSRDRSPGRTRAKSRGRSKSRPRSQSRSPDCNRAKSRGRSKSRPRSRSRSRSRGRSRGRSYSKAESRGRSKSRQRSRSKGRRRSSSSSSSNSHSDDKKCSKDFQELQMARRRKELEEMLSQPTKSILKKRNEDSPSVKSCDASMSHVAEQLLQAVKTTDPRAMVSMLSELRSDPEMSRRAGLDAEIKEILSLLGVAGPAGKAPERPADDIDDEEKFLYGDSEEPKPPPAPEPVRHHSLDLYGEVTEETLYGDYPPQKAAVGPPYRRSPGTSTHLQAPPSTAELDVRYQPAVPDQNATVSNPTFPPGTEPLEESERQALEEYEKIQDLLKTIGLDLGVTEISKMAARTKERLHGSKPPPKTPTRRRRYSSGSSSGSGDGRRRSHSSSSSSRSGWSSDDERRKSSAPPTTPRTKEDGDSKAAAPLPPVAAPPPPHQGVPIPTYPPSHTLMPPNFPPPPFGQYANFLPYVPQQWPPMYPPPNMNLNHHTDDFPPAPPFKQTYSTEPGAGATGPAPDGPKGSCKSSRVSEEQNNESQKQKVLEEREKLKQEREIRMKKKEYLMKELERLRKQQGELLRKKRREKDGHKDPLLQEISHLQEEVMAQISSLRKEHEAAEKKRNEIDKVALILGVSPSDRPRRPGRTPDEESAARIKREAERSPERRQTSSSSTKQISAAPSPSATPLDKPSPTTVAPPIAVAPPPEPFEYYDAGNHWCKNCNITSGSMFDFFTHLHSKTHRKTLDPYDRPWASTPNKISKSVPSEEKLTKPAKGSEFLLPVRGFFCLLCREFYGDAICAEEHVTTHAHNEQYKKQMYENPLYEQRRNLDRQAGLASEASMKKRKHDDDDDDDEEKGGKEEKFKHKKEKKDKEKKKEDDDGAQKEKLKTKKEELEDKIKKEDKTLDEDKPSYSKKDEEEKYKYSKKDDKYRYREEDERGKYSRRDGDDEYRGGKEEEYRYRHRRYNDERYDSRHKYGPRDGEDRNKYGKPYDARFKYDREQDEGKPKAEREGFKKPELDAPAGKLEVSKPEPPPKPYDPPKIFCGPSPAMRAKLRKQSLESGKAAPAPAPAPAATTTTASFAKFTWKKKENQLAKEAAKVAAEFIKEDEAAAKEQPATTEDSFAKSMAVAKEIALKLGGLPSGPPPWASNGANRGRIRPNLPAPASVLRKTTMAGKPAPLNTFLSIRPQNMSCPPKEGPVLPDPLTRALNAQDALLESKTVPPAAKPEPFGLGPPPAASKPAAPRVQPAAPRVQPAPPGLQPAPPGLQPAPPGLQPGAPGLQPGPPGLQPAPPGLQPAPPVSKAATLESKPPPSEARPSMSAPPGVQPAPPVFRPYTLESKPAPSESKLVSSLAPIKVHPAPPVSKPAALDSKLPSSEVKPGPTQAAAAPPPQPTMIKIVSDVAAPGVPESEQTRTVFVKPPPFMNLGEGAQKSEKLKSNLAAAKAQELFDIFYSSIGDSGPSSFTKPAKDNRVDNSADKSPLPGPQVPKAPSQPRPQPLTNSNLPAEVQPPQPDSRNCPPSPQIQTDSNIQIASVWSLQPEEAPPTTSPPPSQSELTPPTTSPPPSQSELTSPCRPEPKTSGPNRSSGPASGVQTAPLVQPAHQEPEPQTESGPEPAPPVQTLSDHRQDQDPEFQPETCPDIAPELESKPGPKTRGKKTPPAPRPARQTRSQTRYQTRQRQQQQNRSEPEPEPVSGDSDSAGLDSKGLDTSDPGSGSHPELEAGAPSEEESQTMEITPETLGLPPDMTSLDFDYDFNFE